MANGITEWPEPNYRKDDRQDRILLDSMTAFGAPELTCHAKEGSGKEGSGDCSPINELCPCYLGQNLTYIPGRKEGSGVRKRTARLFTN